MAWLVRHRRWNSARTPTYKEALKTNKVRKEIADRMIDRLGKTTNQECAHDPAMSVTAMFQKLSIEFLHGDDGHEPCHNGPNAGQRSENH